MAMGIHEIPNVDFSPTCYLPDFEKKKLNQSSSKVTEHAADSFDSQESALANIIQEWMSNVCPLLQL